MTDRTKGYEVAWEGAIATIARKRFEGLQVACPRCGSMGTITSKWLEGVRVKPLYVAHTNGTGSLRLCELNGEGPKTFRSGVRLTTNDLVKLLRMGRPFVLFSGGNDSLCLLDCARRAAERIGRKVTALHADTTAGLPEVEEHVRKVCRKFHVPLVVVRPPHDYFELAKRWGIPGVRARWCCETLKIAPIRRYLSGISGSKIILDGIRAAESSLRATYIPVWYHPSFRCISASPIFSWSNEKVRQYLLDRGLPKSPTEEMGTSGECWCGAYKCRADFEALLRINEGIFDKLIDVEDAQEGRFTFIFENGKRVPLRSLKRAAGQHKGV